MAFAPLPWATDVDLHPPHKPAPLHACSTSPCEPLATIRPRSSDDSSGEQGSRGGPPRGSTAHGGLLGREPTGAPHSQGDHQPAAGHGDAAERVMLLCAPFAAAEWVISFVPPYRFLGYVVYLFLGGLCSRAGALDVMIVIKTHEVICPLANASRGCSPCCVRGTGIQCCAESHQVQALRPCR